MGGDFKEKKTENKFIEKTGRNSYSLTKEFTKHLRKDVLQDLASLIAKRSGKSGKVTEMQSA